MTAKTYTVIENGVATEWPMSDEMAASMERAAAWDGWCRCDNPETGHCYPRGHSVDVDCRNCGGWLQIG